MKMKARLKKVTHQDGSVSYRIETKNLLFWYPITATDLRGNRKLISFDSAEEADAYVTKSLWVDKEEIVKEYN